MIIDCHSHLLHPEVRRKDYKLPKEESVIKATFYKHPDIESVFPLSSMEGLLDSMEKSNIDRTIVMGLSWYTHEICVENNAYVKECVERYPDKLIGFGVLQPKAGDEALRELEKCLNEYGFKGIKIIPYFQGYKANDDVMFPIMKKVIKYDIPIMIHVDQLFYPPDRDMPYFVYDLASKFPEAKIICAHLGGLLCFYNLFPRTREVIKNLYFDTSVPATMKMVEFAAQVVDEDKLIFGTDFPFNYGHSQRLVLKDFWELQILDELKEKICCENILKLVGG